ncbi:MAG: bacterial Ig-like domain-containing protein [Erysipelotrichaceae bacterium]|nr:bacterial Ig-like domain-containing protein [Erysipelotrichaceae bacterium]
MKKALIVILIIANLFCGLLIYQHWHIGKLKAESLAALQQEVFLRLSDQPVELTCGEGMWDCRQLVESCGGELSVDCEQIDLSMPGEHVVTFTVSRTDQYGQSVTVSDSRTVTVIDAVSPVIRFRSETVSMIAGGEFNPADNLLDVSDDVDGQLSLGEELLPGSYTVSSSVNNMKTGTYKVTVEAMDRQGNRESASYSVTVRSAKYYRNPAYKGEKLTKKRGTINGPSGKETYYNLNMDGVIRIMRSRGNNDPYWIREDGCKMLGDYIMVAANLEIRPRGTLVLTSLGMGIVCDTGAFAHRNVYQLDIAVDW